MIKVTCKECGKNLEAPDEAAGQKGKCPRCLETFKIPLVPVAGQEENKIRCPHCGKLFSMTPEQQAKIDDVSSDTIFKCPGCLKPLNKGIADKTPGLIPCPSCKKEISEAAKSCPGCGYELTPEAVGKAKKNKNILGSEASRKDIIGGVVTILFLFLVILTVRSCSQITLPKHAVEVTSLAPKTGSRVAVKVYDAISKDECVALVKKYRNRALPDGQISVQFPFKDEEGTFWWPCCVENPSDGEGLIFHDYIWREFETDGFRHLNTPPVGKSPFPSLNPLELEIGQSYVVSKEIPLMPSHSPADPIAAIQQMKQLPQGGEFKVLEVYKDKTNPWYKVIAFDQRTEQMGTGWINSTALLGQQLKARK